MLKYVKLINLWEKWKNLKRSHNFNTIFLFQNKLFHIFKVEKIDILINTH